MIFVLFKDGRRGWYIQYLVEGACFIDDPTAYIYRQVGIAMKRVYVKPGQSVDWIEA